MTSLAMGHRFTRKKISTGEPLCGDCGLVWRTWDHHPPLSCPHVPLSSINIEWVERYT